MANRRILVISDTHAPYHHKDTIRFLKAIKDEYAPDRIIHIGDEIDNHAMSYHYHSPDLFSAGEELIRAREVIWQIEDMFPKVDVLESNHGSLWYRKAKTHGIPREALKTYEEILKTKKSNCRISNLATSTTGGLQTSLLLANIAVCLSSRDTITRNLISSIGEPRNDSTGE